MPRQTNFVTLIRGIVREHVQEVFRDAFGSFAGTKTKAKNGRRRRRKARGKWRPGGPGRPPKAVAEKMAAKKAGVGRGSKTKAGRRGRRRRGRRRRKRPDTPTVTAENEPEAI